MAVSYTHLDVYKRQAIYRALSAGQPVPATRRMSLQQLLDADDAASTARDEDVAFWEASGALEQEDTSLAGRTASPSAQSVRLAFSIDTPTQQALLLSLIHISSRVHRPGPLRTR